MLFVEIARDLLDPAAVDLARALWRLRRLRKYQARPKYTVVRGPELPTPKYPPLARPAGFDDRFEREAYAMRALEQWRAERDRRATTTNRGVSVSNRSNEAPLTLRGTGSMGLFSGVSLKDVKIGGGKAMDFKGEGDFVVKVTEVKGGETRKREKYFEVIHEVVESTIPDVQPVGSKTNLFCMLQGSGQDIGLQNMKEILCVLSGLNPHSNADADKIAQISDEEWVQIAELACAEPKTFGGKLANVSVTEVAIAKPKPGGRTHYLRRRYTPNAATVAPKAETKKAGK